MGNHSKSVSYSNCTISVPVPQSSTSLIIGKRGSTIKRLSAMQKIVSVKILNGSIVVTGASRFYVDKVLNEVAKLVVTSISKGFQSYRPDLDIICFPCCENGFLLEPFDVNGNDHRGFTWRRNADVEGASVASQRALAQLLPSPNQSAMTKQAPEGMKKEHYVVEILQMLAKIHSTISRRSKLKLEVRLGKSLLALKQVVASTSMFVLNIDQMGLLHRRFADQAISSSSVSVLVKSLTGSGYSRVQNTGRKVRLHLVDATLGTVHLVSLLLTKVQMQAVMSGGLNYFMASELFDQHDRDQSREDFSVSTVQRKPNRHCFVASSHESKAVDVRLSVLTREEDTSAQELLMQVEKAWASRLSTGIPKFESGSKFHASAVRYKETHKFLCNEILVKVSKVALWEYEATSWRYQWEVSVKSLWLKANLGTVRHIGDVDMKAAMDCLQAWLVEAGRLSRSLSLS